MDPARVHPWVEADPGDGTYVLYWMIANRRTRRNPALERAIAHCEALELPLVVFEPLRIGYRWASVRHHQFIMDGMEDNRAAFDAAGVRYLSYVEPEPDAGKGLLARLAADAAVVVTDATPMFFLPRMLEAAAKQIEVLGEAVDGVGVLPMAAAPRAFPTAASFRRHLQKHVLEHLGHPTAAEPLAGYSQGLAEDPSWWDEVDSADDPSALDIEPLEATDRGGPIAGQALVDAFFDDTLDRYHEDRNHPDLDGASGLSPYLHYGHVSSEDIVRRVLDRCGWDFPDEAPKATGSRGWWGLPEGAEAFMDEIVTWRELAHSVANHDPEHDSFAATPDWAKKTLSEHADDTRELVDFDTLEAAASPDPVWNAAQTQLVQTGRMHNYLRMLWGKKVLQWAPDPETAFDWLLHWNNKYALDGRDPNSTAGVGWVFGRHDRAWGPERPIFGKVRYMTSQSTKRKLKLKDYLERFGA